MKVSYNENPLQLCIWHFIFSLVVSLNPLTSLNGTYNHTITEDRGEDKQLDRKE